MTTPMESVYFTCRGCLTVETEAVLHSLANDKVRSLFTNCTNVSISLEEKTLPLQICSLCFGRCENWESFRNRCQENDEQLRAKCISEQLLGVESPGEWYATEGSYRTESIASEDCDAEAKPEIEPPIIEYQELYVEEDLPTPGPSSSRSSGPSCDKNQIVICEECGKEVKGMLSYRKHMFYHEKKMTKRMRDVKKKLDTTKSVVVKKEEVALLQSWTQKARKKLRVSGQEYINTKAVVVGKKSVKPVLCSCVHKCNEQFTDADRHRIFSFYWSHDYGGQRRFINENVYERRCQRQIVIYDSRRRYTLEYSFEGRRCCKKFFLGTLDITDRTVMVCKAKARQNMDVEKDLRGSNSHGKGQ